jgi:uncharacterized damage-inducible protein DinB
MIASVRKQYGLVQVSRNLLLEFIGDRLGDEQMNKPFPEYADKSIGDLLGHNAGCYFHWLAYLALQRPWGSLQSRAATLSEIQQVFTQVDHIMTLFLDHFADAMDVPFNGVFDDNWRVRVTPYELFVHVTTHEFHHKGQIVLMARLLGHAPPDTDVSNAFSAEPPE